MDKRGYVYIMTNDRNTVFYTGVTSMLSKRSWEHKSGVVHNSFTEKYNVHKLVYFEIYESIQNAIEREKYIKGKKREFKLELIGRENPTFRDLFQEIL